jgi:hypothetical protein
LLLTVLLGGFFTLGGGLLASPFQQHAHAQTAASAISQSFETDETDISIGSLVSLNKDASSKVALSTTTNTDSLVGVVADSSLVEIEPGGAAKATRLQVVTDGVTETLVSDINGEVKVGDRIAPSPIRGVGMKLSDNAQIIGVAQGNFAGIATTTREITSNSGTKVSVKIGRVPVRVSIGFYSGNPSSEDGKPSTPIIQRLANAVAGKETSTVRMIISFTLLGMGFLVMIIILRTAVASSLTSIGRNPLSADAIHKNFNGVAFIALGVLLVALATSYLALVI